MNTKAVRIHGKMDLRLEDVVLPEVGPDDVQVKIVSDSVCMSTYKAAVEGEEHKRVPDDVAEHPSPETWNMPCSTHSPRRRASWAGVFRVGI